MSGKKQLRGRGFISVQVSGEIVHYGQKVWKLWSQETCLSNLGGSESRERKFQDSAALPPPPFLFSVDYIQGLVVLHS